MGGRGSVGKGQKIGHGRGPPSPHHASRGVLWVRGGRAQDLGGTLDLLLSDIFYICKKTVMKKPLKINLRTMGMDIERGRLVNRMPPGRTLLSVAAEARKVRRREEKISMMVDADVRAEMREEMMGGGGCEMCD